MANPHGSFIWYELMSTDPDASTKFYDDVVGWKIGAKPPGDMDYRMISAPDGHVGGVLRLTDEMRKHGARPVWLGYIGVDDVDDTVAKLTAAGGRVLMPAWDIPNVGRIAMVTDPQGIPFYVMRGASDGTSTAFGRMAMGHVSWNELMTPDQTAALAFYDSLFGIVKSGAMPMGEMGDYTFLQHAGVGIGAMMTNPPGGKPGGWGFYFRVPDIDAAKDKVTRGGGTVTHGPMEVPGGEMVLSAVDPNGAAFGLVAPGKRS
jgi:predicted enzyme related to lactoylglutathione lyase